MGAIWSWVASGILKMTTFFFTILNIYPKVTVFYSTNYLLNVTKWSISFFVWIKVYNSKGYSKRSINWNSFFEEYKTGCYQFWVHSNFRYYRFIHEWTSISIYFLKSNIEHWAFSLMQNILLLSFNSKCIQLCLTTNIKEHQYYF